MKIRTKNVLFNFFRFIKKTKYHFLSKLFPIPNSLVYANGATENQAYDDIMSITEFDPKSSLRDLKIKMITTDEIKFFVKTQNIKVYEKELDILRLFCPDDVITGSLALNLYGLINRDCNDIDIIIKDKNRYPKGHYRKNLYRFYNQNGMYDNIFSENRLGYKQHSYIKEFTIKNRLISNLLYPFTLVINSLIKVFGNEYKINVDYFIDNNNVNFNTFEYKGHTFKIHCPIQIIEQKLDMYLKNSDVFKSFISACQKTMWSVKMSNKSIKDFDKNGLDLFFIFKNLNN
jgi:hypothetical protein